MKHTPGPWTTPSTTATTSLRIDTPRGSFIVSCSGLPKREEWAANGKLIAAAPEMLDALESLYYLVSEVANPGAFDNGVYAPDGRCEGDVLAGRVIEQARIAIMKAGGGKA